MTEDTHANALDRAACKITMTTCSHAKHQRFARTQRKSLNPCIKWHALTASHAHAWHVHTTRKDQNSRCCNDAIAHALQSHEHARHRVCLPARPAPPGTQWSSPTGDPQGKPKPSKAKLAFPVHASPKPLLAMAAAATPLPIPPRRPPSLRRPRLEKQAVPLAPARAALPATPCAPETSQPCESLCWRHAWGAQHACIVQAPRQACRVGNLQRFPGDHARTRRAPTHRSLPSLGASQGRALPPCRQQLQNAAESSGGDCTNKTPGSSSINSKSSSSSKKHWRPAAAAIAQQMRHKTPSPSLQ